MSAWPKPVADSINRELADYSARELGGRVAKKFREALRSERQAPELRPGIGGRKATAASLPRAGKAAK
jgi:hypothetical protein